MKAAESRLVEPTFNAALCLECGFGVDRNPDAAFAAYRSIANDYSPAERRSAPSPSDSFRVDGIALILATFAVVTGICAVGLFAEEKAVEAVVLVVALVSSGFYFISERRFSSAATAGRKSTRKI